MYDADPISTFLIKTNKAGTNWYDAITDTAFVQRLGIGFQGGSEKGRFYIGLSTFWNEGILINNELRRHTLRVNSEYDITPFLSVGNNTQVTYRQNKSTGAGGSIESADDELSLIHI